ncbi:NIPSNAP family protein [Sphingomonas sp. YL-JM2C]
MIYELRIYKMAPGRMPSAIDRFERLPAIFDRLGFNLLGRWQALAGLDAPSIVYLMGFPDFAAREEQWASFYVDPDWLALRKETNAGEEMITRFDVFFLRECPVWAPSTADAARPLGGVHELRLYDIGVGQIPRAHQFLRDVQLPAIAARGGRVTLLADMVSGPDIPGCVSITAWPDLAAWRSAALAIEEDEAINRRWRSDRAGQEGTALGAWRQWLLEPLPNPFPAAALTLARSD